MRLQGVARHFGRGGVVVRALDGVDLEVGTGEFVAVHGRSGSGKTTLLNVVGGLDRPDAGRVEVCGQDLVDLSEARVIALRRERLAFVFQAFGLLPVLSAAENVEVPLRLRRLPAPQRRERVAELLELVGLTERAAHRPHELSGGEQQRVAIARALANNPELLIADEPTGQLDSGTGRLVMDLLRSLVDARGLAMIVATHDPTMIADADRVVEMVDGRVQEGGVVRARHVDRVSTERRSITTSPTMPRESGRGELPVLDTRNPDADVPQEHGIERHASPIREPVDADGTDDAEDGRADGGPDDPSGGSDRPSPFAPPE